MKYFIWHEGEEHGPYEFDQLFESWKEGTLPQGFLWRRETSTQFSMPEALEAESQLPPTAPPPVVPVKSAPQGKTQAQEKPFVLVLPGFSSALGWMLILLGLMMSLGSAVVGSGMVSLGFVILFSGWCSTVLDGITAIVNRMDRISRQLEQRDRS